jgi:predicted nucleic-acid-binding Zn-ribbon protein
MKNIQETITHVGILEQNSTNIGLPRFMTMSCVNCEYEEWCVVVREVLIKYDVCVK